MAYKAVAQPIYTQQHTSASRIRGADVVFLKVFL